MTRVAQVVEVLEQLAPLRLAEEWDNVGLLVGDPDAEVSRVMTCLTVTPETVAEAVEGGAQLIVTHHPLPFRPLKHVTTASTPGRLLLDLIRHQVAVYSAHTAFDSAQAGINQHLAIGLGLQEIRPLTPDPLDPEEGVGRWGFVSEPLTLRELAERAKTFLGIDQLRLVGADDRPVNSVAIACGAGSSLLDLAIQAGCDAMVTGEASFHACLEAEARNLGLVLPGHFASERFAMLSMADYVAEQLAHVEVWTSARESDPLRTV